MDYFTAGHWAPAPSMRLSRLASNRGTWPSRHQVNCDLAQCQPVRLARSASERCDRSPASGVVPVECCGISYVNDASGAADSHC